MSKEHLEKRFGVIAVEKGFVTADQVVEAMRIQIKEDVEKGKHRLIGVILVGMGVMNTSQVDEVLEEL
jgi:hypothetical protein